MTTDTYSQVKQTPEQLTAIAAELERISKTKRDYVVPASKLAMDPTGTALVASLVEGAPPTPFNVRKIAHEQIAEKMGIHASYYKRMQDGAGDLLAQNVNYWLERNGKKHLLRTLDGQARALLSDSYRTLDNHDLFFQTFGVVQEVGATVLRADVTDEKLYMRAVHPEWQERIATQRARHAGGKSHSRIDFDKDGDGGTEIVIPSVIVRNSEVGRGGLSVESGYFFQWCSNLAIADKSLFQVHIGGKMDEGEWVSTEARDAQDSALWLKVRDLVRATFDREAFRKMVATFQEAANEQIDEPVQAVEAVVKNFGMTEDAKQAILNKLMSDGDSTRFGLMNAVTYQGHAARAAGDIEAEMVYSTAGLELLTSKRELVRVKA